MAIQKRLTCDPCLGVSDIMAPFLQYFKEQGKYDMRGLIEPKVVPTWKTAPDPEWLASLHPKQPSDPSEPRISPPVTLTLASSSSQTPGTSEAQGMKVHMGSSSSVRIDLAFDEKELLANALALKIPDKKAKKPRRMLKSFFLVTELKPIMRW